MKRVIASLVAVTFTAGAAAHHSYAMFDGTRVQSVTGTIAKLEWANPHVFVWVYVPRAQSANGYDLYAFENGSTNVLLRRGWTKDALPPGQEVTLDYWPLRDGRKGGHLKTVKLSSGRVLQGAGGPRGVDGEAPANAAPASRAAP